MPGVADQGPHFCWLLNLSGSLSVGQFLSSWDTAARATHCHLTPDCGLLAKGEFRLPRWRAFDGYQNGLQLDVVGASGNGRDHQA